MKPYSYDFIPQHSTILIGFSGGPDSVYLLLYLKKLQESLDLNLIAVHLDHQWRTESKQDAIWCLQFCKKQSIPCVVKKASDIKLAKKYNGSQEEYGRILRRTVFEQEAKKYPNAYIALAHHQDDQLETFFIRLARGASLSGLTGIKQKDFPYVRPLLTITKQEILKYLKEHSIDFLQDPSNTDQTFLRNRIRHTLLPCLQETDQRFTKNIFATMNQFKQIEKFLVATTEQTIQQLALTKNPTTLDINQFLKIDPVLQQRIILSLLIQIKATFTPSSSLLQEIIRFITTGKNKQHHIHTTYKIVKNTKSFSIVKT